MAGIARKGLALGGFALALMGAAPPPPALDKENPTCPAKPDWGQAKAITVTPAVRNGKHVLIADGIIDAGFPNRLKAAIDADEQVEEVWIRSRGGDAHAGNAAGKVIRSYPGMVTRIPAGWTCFSACNFVFMGGDRRFVDPGGVFMVHMFTHTGDRDTIELSVEEGTEETTRLIGEIEQSSALLASEDNDFLIRMGISRKLLTEVMYKQQAVASAANKSTRYCLTQDEVRKYNVMPTEKVG
ncbi:hypothetical protein [Novosphingobium cyanobacteriorum]|uniref:Peptidase S14 n=1 Tax=Novosphingobium cyanobacteriorum TaxID=3024215 RepID=A0ABT6CMK7_9SPHN|nr:hypothetical protein [Novosphingobium cyanobacteriorum]MDF8334808.1 hypothetical protein [Novosphingobium cyanobacteriorum]